MQIDSTYTQLRYILDQSPASYMPQADAAFLIAQGYATLGEFARDYACTPTGPEAKQRQNAYAQTCRTHNRAPKLLSTLLRETMHKAMTPQGQKHEMTDFMLRSYAQAPELNPMRAALLAEAILTGGAMEGVTDQWLKEKGLTNVLALAQLPLPELKQIGGVGDGKIELLNKGLKEYGLHVGMTPSEIIAYAEHPPAHFTETFGLTASRPSNWAESVRMVHDTSFRAR